MFYLAYKSSIQSFVFVLFCGLKIVKLQINLCSKLWNISSIL